MTVAGLRRRWLDLFTFAFPTGTAYISSLYSICTALVPSSCFPLTLASLRVRWLRRRTFTVVPAGACHASRLAAVGASTPASYFPLTLAEEKATQIGLENDIKTALLGTLDVDIVSFSNIGTSFCLVN
jgi:hypothetical protein